MTTIVLGMHPRLQALSARPRALQTEGAVELPNPEVSSSLDAHTLVALERWGLAALGHQMRVYEPSCKLESNCPCIAEVAATSMAEAPRNQSFEGDSP